MSAEGSPVETKSRIPVTLVTGFLGSGKTTLINAALRAPELAKTVVVVNEFGEVGLDHLLFARSSDSVVVLENGCLCCTVRSDLVGTLNSLYHARQAGEIPAFNNVVIETSGLAEPGPVLQAFLSEPTLDGLYRVASVLTLVDAVNWPGTSEAHEELVRQVGLADQIRITKLDMVTGDRQNGASRIGSISVGSTRQPRSRKSIGRRRWSRSSSRLRGSTRPTRTRTPVRGSMWKPIKTRPIVTSRAATIIITKVIITSMITLLTHTVTISKAGVLRISFSCARTPLVTRRGAVSFGRDRTKPGRRAPSRERSREHC